MQVFEVFPYCNSTETCCPAKFRAVMHFSHVARLALNNTLTFLTLGSKPFSKPPKSKVLFSSPVWFWLDGIGVGCLLQPGLLMSNLYRKLQRNEITSFCLRLRYSGPQLPIQEDFSWNLFRVVRSDYDTPQGLFLCRKEAMFHNENFEIVENPKAQVKKVSKV